MIKAIIFDLDGTLLDRATSLAFFVNHQYDRLVRGRRHVPKSEFGHYFTKLDKNGHVPKNEVYQQIVDHYQLESSLIEVLHQDYQDNFHGHCVQKDGLEDLMIFLKKEPLKIGMITNGQTNFQTRSIEALNIGTYFDQILISEQEGLKKPSSEIFHRAFIRLGVQAEESLFVGDHPSHDIQAAKLVGMRTIWIQNDVYKRPDQSDFSIQSLSEIKPIIQSMNRRINCEN